MSEPMNRREFIKGVTAIVGGLITILRNEVLSWLTWQRSTLSAEIESCLLERCRDRQQHMAESANSVEAFS